jgi:hypothetical protein
LSDARWTAGLSDADLRQTMVAALRLLGALTVVLAVAFGLKMGWQSALLAIVGATISGFSLWEWMRLITAMNAAMDGGALPRPMGTILTGFFLRLALTVVVLYVSLKYLHGTVFALAAGIGLGVLSLTIEALKLMKRWTV